MKAAADRVPSGMDRLVFLGFEAPEEGEEQAFFDRMENWAGQLPRVVLVDSSGGMSLET